VSFGRVETYNTSQHDGGSVMMEVVLWWRQCYDGEI